MGVVLHGLIGRCCVAYLEDIVIFSRTLEEHLAHLDEVLGRLALAHLKVKPRKCEFLKKEVHYLGHRVSAEGILPDDGKIEAVKAWPVPRNPGELRRFLGFVSFYRRFVDHCADTMASLYDALPKRSSL